jgi:hypothetical protein
LHIHLKGDLIIEEAILKSPNDCVIYGIAVNCGLGVQVHNDSQIDPVITFLRKYPQFYVSTIVDILNNEPVDIYINPTYLPLQMSDCK